jgi:hypothetical protein
VQPINSSPARKKLVKDTQDRHHTHQHERHPQGVAIRQFLKQSLRFMLCESPHLKERTKNTWQSMLERMAVAL